MNIFNTSCDGCGLLLDLYRKVDCSIANLIGNKWNSIKYGVSTYFDSIQYENLIHYKRMLYRMITSGEGSKDELISSIIKDLYKPNSCLKCC